jgi:hypothetical protein
MESFCKLCDTVISGGLAEHQATLTFTSLWSQLSRKHNSVFNVQVAMPSMLKEWHAFAFEGLDET